MINSDVFFQYKHIHYTSNSEHNIKSLYIGTIPTYEVEHLLTELSLKSENPN